MYTYMKGKRSIVITWIWKWYSSRKTIVLNWTRGHDHRVYRNNMLILKIIQTKRNLYFLLTCYCTCVHMRINLFVERSLYNNLWRMSPSWFPKIEGINKKRRRHRVTVPGCARIPFVVVATVRENHLSVSVPFPVPRCRTFFFALSLNAEGRR
jgi:hypothetical protein